MSLEQRLGGHPQEVAKTMKRATAQDKVEREMLKLLARDTDTYRAFVEQLEPEHFRNPANRRMFVAIEEADGDVAAIAGGEDAKLASAVSSLAVEPLNGGERRGVRAERVGATAGVPAEEQERRHPHAAPEAESRHRYRPMTTCSSNWSAWTANSVAWATASRASIERR